MGGDIRRKWDAQMRRLNKLATRAPQALTRRSNLPTSTPSPPGAVRDQGQHYGDGASQRRFAAEELKLTVLESVRDAIITVDEEGRVMDFNSAAEEIFGFPRRDVIDRPATDLLVPPRLRERYADALDRLNSEGFDTAGKTFETIGLRSDGSEVRLEISLGRVTVSGRTLVVICGRDITKRKQTEASRAQLASLVQASNDAIIGHTLDGTITSWNPGATQLFGYDADEVLGKSVTDLLTPDGRGLVPVGSELARAATPHEREALATTKEGRGIHVALTTSPVRPEKGRVTHAVTVVRDISERVEADARRAELEQQLHQSQKMEAIGRLASGVAHDFNNLLSVIINYANFLADDLKPGTAAHDDVERIRQAGHSAVGLVRQLLLFSRKEAVTPQIVDANQLVLGMETLLRRTISEDIQLETRLATDLWLTKIDPGQMEQILMNLAVNARDAMPHGGTLFIDTSNVATDEYFARKTGAPAGDYVKITVTDNGPGMTSDVIEHIFEPFFTTKAEGEGTGLGLATVYAIVQRAGGTIGVTSEPGVGTRFDIHLPATHEQQEQTADQEPSAVRGDGQRILLVEDEEAVRELAMRILSANGYEVLAARSGQQALEVCGELEGPLHLLLSDVIMPHMSGQELAGWLQQMKPGFATIYMSGYTDQAVGARALDEEGVAFLQKPFTAERLLQQVHDVLASQRSIPSAG